MIPNATRSAMVTALGDLLDGGYMEVRVGAQPADPDDVPTGTLLATIPLGTPAFGAAVNGVITADVTGAETVGVNTGTPGWYRAYTVADVPVIDGSDDMQLSVPTVVPGTPVRILSWTLTMPDGS